MPFQYEMYIISGCPIKAGQLVTLLLKQNYLYPDNPLSYFQSAGFALLS